MNDKIPVKEEGAEASLFVGDRIIEINRGSKRKPPTITIELSKHHLQGVEEEAEMERLLDGLIERMTNFFTNVPIRGLRLEWKDHTDTNNLNQLKK